MTPTEKKFREDLDEVAKGYSKGMPRSCMCDGALWAFQWFSRQQQKVKVEIIESERGWGQKVDEVKTFDTREEDAIEQIDEEIVQQEYEYLTKQTAQSLEAQVQELQQRVARLEEMLNEIIKL